MSDHSQLSLLYELYSNGVALCKPDIAKELDLDDRELDQFVFRLKKLGVSFSESQMTLEFGRTLYLLNSDTIRDMLSDFARQRLTVLPPFLSINSTNQVIKEYAAKFEEHVFVAMTEHQFDGRGRQGKEWVASLGNSVLMSLGIRLNLAVAKIGFISLLVGISLVQVLNDLGLKEVSIKWPNDIYWSDAKLAGILIESVKLVDGDIRLVIGIGLNVNFGEDVCGAISQPWVDLKQMTDAPICRNVLIASILNKLMLNLAEFERVGAKGFMRKWHKFDYLNEKPIALTAEGRPQVIGLAKGVNEKGELLVQTDCCLQAFFSGDVSVRPLLR